MGEVALVRRRGYPGDRRENGQKHVSARATEILDSLVRENVLSTFEFNAV